MNYEMPAVEMLKTLGYRESGGVEWLSGRELPEVYRRFMELAADNPLFGTSDLWTGKMSHGVCIPGTFYEELREAIEDRKDRWPKRMGRYEKTLYALSQLPPEDWPGLVEDYLLIGSDYAGGMGVFGVRMGDLSEEDPPVYWKKDGAGWKLENEKLSDFLRAVLTEVLACGDYQTAEDALEPMGWRFEEYYDVKKEDWIASKAVLKRYGISYPELKRYRGSSGTVFCCYDESRNVFFTGATEEGALSLCAISRADTEHIFLDLDSLEYLLEEARLCVRDRERTDEISMYDVYTKTPCSSVRLSDTCFLEDPLPEGASFLETAKNGRLYVLCSGKTLMEAVERALKRNPKAGVPELAAALNKTLTEQK